MNWPTITLILGFFLFLFGFLALILSLVGLQFSFLTFIDGGGQSMGLLVRLLMIFGGVTLMYVARSKFEK